MTYTKKQIKEVHKIAKKIDKKGGARNPYAVAWKVYKQKHKKKRKRRKK